jgi:ABC-type transport system involved in multi-copper enzyme maturation permease subunit
VSQFLSVFRFELKVRFTRPPVYIFAVLFFFLAFGLITTDVVMVSGGVGNVARNSPFSILTATALIAMFGSLVTAAFVATAVQRDHELGTQGLFFTTSLDKRSYLAGRFCGSMVAVLTVLFSIGLGLLLGSFMPWIEEEQLVAFDPFPYLYAFGLVVLPGALLTGAIFFAIATLTRRVLYAYVAFLGLTVFYFTTQAFIGDLDNEFIVALADPFGLSPLGLSMRYWTTVERNTLLPELKGPWLWNRVLWTALAMVIFAATVRRFRMKLPEGGKRARSVALDEPAQPAARHETALPSVTRTFDSAAHLSQLWTQVRVETRNLVTGMAFVVICLFAIANVALTAYAITDTLGGTSVFPVTGLMLQAVQGGMSLFVVIVIIFYSGALFHKEREVKLNELHDALPVPTWVFMLGKLSALLVASAALLAVAILTTVIFQLVLGYTHIELGLYLRGTYLIALPGFILMAVMAVFTQVVANHKYMGFMLMVLVIIINIALPALDFEHNLYTYGDTPGIPYSDMNGYGHFVPAVAWFTLYWAVGAGFLLLLCELLWVRGTDNRLRMRLRRARKRLDGRRKAAMGLTLAAQFGIGAFIFYNTNVLNEYVPSDQREDESAEYERRYKQYEKLPHPRVTGVEMEVDIFASERRVDARGHMTLENKHEVEIRELHVLYNKDLEMRRLEIPGSSIREDDAKHGYRIYDLDMPLAPGAKMKVDFDFGRSFEGFVVSGSDTSIVSNGTFFNNVGYVPHFGYSDQFELTDPTKRKEQDLPERERMASVDDMEARANNYLSGEADWIDFKATVSTDEGQIALAPGYLQRDWKEGDRHYFRYEMDAPILYFFAFLSAEYAVARDVWKPGTEEEVAIEIYHHPSHDQNVARMIDAIKKSLDYYTENFSPYQHRQVRILEFPGYQSFAQSFPNTIPYSESIGFIADASGEDDIDYVFYVTAHEVAHQWWAHQVMGGNVQGGTLMSETLSQYSALMIMEQEYGREHMEKFLRYELDRYLQGRGTERREEMPLMLVENQQYIHYRKGSLVMYALREYIGEEELNRALAAYIDEVAFQQPPWTNSREFLAHIEAVTPEELKYFVEDSFEKITLYDNRAKSAKARQLEDGRWELTLEVSARKVYAEGKGEEVETSAESDFIEIGVFGEGKAEGGSEGEEERMLYLEKHQLGADEKTFTLIVDDEPKRAGIDPRHLLIDRNPGDNDKTVEIAEE